MGRGRGVAHRTKEVGFGRGQASVLIGVSECEDFRHADTQFRKVDPPVLILVLPTGLRNELKQIEFHPVDAVVAVDVGDPQQHAPQLHELIKLELFVLIGVELGESIRLARSFGDLGRFETLIAIEICGPKKREGVLIPFDQPDLLITVMIELIERALQAVR